MPPDQVAECTGMRTLAGGGASDRGPAVGDYQPECGAAPGLKQFNRAAVGSQEFLGDREAEARAAAALGGLKGLEQVVTGAWREARAIIADLDRDCAIIAAGYNLD